MSARAALAETAPLIRNYTAEEIGTTAKVKCLLETEAGILYAGADRLLVFDGTHWTQARVENMPEILSLCWEGDRLWAGGQGELGYFEKSEAGEYLYKRMTARLGDNFYGTISRIFCVGENIIFVTEHKVVQLPIEKGAARIWELPSEQRLRAFFINGAIYINQTLAVDKIKTWVLQNDALEPDSSLVGPDGHYRMFIGQSEGQWIFGSDYDLYKRDVLLGDEKRLYTDNGELRQALLSGAVCKNGMTYIATQYGGVFMIGLDGSIRKVRKAQGLASDYCSAIATSQTSGVWVALDEGVSFIHDIGEASWISLPGLALAFCGNRDDLLVSSSQSSFHYTAEKKEEIPLARITSWARLGNNLFTAVAGKILCAKNGSSSFSEWGDIWGGPKGVVIADRNSDHILYSESSMGMSRIDVRTGQRTNVEIPEGAGYFLQDKKGQLWVSTLAGSIVMLDEQLQKGTVQISGRTRVNLALHEGEPVVLYNEPCFITIKGDHIQGSEKVLDARGTENGDGPGWIAGSLDNQQRVGVLAQGESGLRWQRKNIPGLKRFKTVSALHAAQNDLWVGGDGGIIQVDITKLADPVTSLPEATFRVRNITNKTQRSLPANTRSFVLSNDEQEIALKFNTHVWGLLEPPQYESRLLPLEEEWTVHKYGDVIARKNLPTGQYTLQVRARHLGETGPVTEFRLWRKLPWYLSYVSITLFAFAGSLAFYGAVKLRTRQILARNRELEAKIVERTQELAKANAAKSEFLAAMSHEIRNPMNGVIGIVKILQEAKLGAREKYYLTTLHRCAEQLRTTVDDVLDFSKIEAGKITLHLDTFDLAESINATISAVDLTGDRLELASWAGQRPVVTGDQGKFMQILTNYFNNALKYGVPPNATIDVFVLGEGLQHCRVTVAVKNAGPDILPHELPTLFERFTRGEYATRGRIGGSGLGLSICKKFAEAMGGGVAATSSGGVTVFQLTIPFEIAHVRTKAADMVSASRQLHARALAIEDEDYNRLVLGSILQKLGYRVDWACDGKTALQLAQQNGYDLVLTDLMLPDTDGGTLTKDILAVCEEPKPPVFAVTAYSTKEKEEECMRAGMAGFISKPITLEKLEAALQNWADGRRGAGKAVVEQAEGGPSVAVQQLAKLGPLEIIIPDFTKKIQSEWALIDRMLEDRECTPAANAAHKLISAMLLVEADVASDQLRLLESRLRDGALESEIEKVRQICREEVEAVAKSLKIALTRRQRINEAQSPM